MTTVLDIIKDAMSESTILTKDEDPTNGEAQNALRILNRMLGSWTNSAALQFERVTESFPLNNLQTTYTIGTGGDFNTTRPTKIVHAHVRQSNTDYNLDIANDAKYQSITYKSIGGLPEVLNFTNEFPLATINIYPAPSSIYTLFITSEKALTSYPTTATTVNLPPGWEDALVYNLAVRLARVYGQPTDPDLKELARASKASIALNALRNNPLQSQLSTKGSDDNIYTGYGR